MITMPAAVGGAQASRIKNRQSVCGFHIDSAGGNDGLPLADGKLDFPDSTFTQAFKVNDHEQVVGFYLDLANHNSWFLAFRGQFQSIDDPHGVGTNTINGINDDARIVGFYVHSQGNTDGLAGTPRDEDDHYYRR